MSVGGFLAGNVTGGFTGYWLGGNNKVSSQELFKANAKIHELEQKMAALSNAQSKIDQLNSEKQALQNELNAEKQKVNTLNTQIANKDAELTALKSTLNANGNEKDQQILALTNEKSALQTQVNNLITEKTTLTNKVSDLTTENNNLKSNNSDAIIKDIFGADNASNLATKKEQLKKTFKLGEILEESIESKDFNTNMNDLNLRFHRNWKGWHTLQNKYRAKNFKFEVDTNRQVYAHEYMKFGLGGVTGSFSMIGNIVSRYMMSFINENGCYKDFTGFVNFAVKLVNDIKESKLVE